MKNITIIFDPAHGVDVKGKCSPDKSHYEYLWSRERIKNLVPKLSALGYEVCVTTNSDKEPGLSKRRDFASQKRGENKLLISLHNNAAGDGSKWMDAQGVEIFTTPGITKSDICADYFLQQFKKDFPSIKLRYNKDAYLERDKEEKFTVLMGSGYMAVLIEWLFQDNRQDVKLLESSITNEKFEDSIVRAIEAINDYFSK